MLRYMRRPERLARRLRPALLACAAVLALGAGTVTPAAATADEPAGSTARGSARGSTAAVAERPAFQMPFPCATTWQLNTWGHNPALDMVVEGNTGSDAKPVQSSAAGTVSATYSHPGSGNTIQINHGNGWFTAYYHLKDAPDAYVHKGDAVTTSTQIGRIGTTGNSTWSHLHYEQRYLADGDFTDESHRVAVRFDGVEYTGAAREWLSVRSNNCGGGGNPSPPWKDCPSGFVCFYSGADGTGSVCRTGGDDPSSDCGLRKSYFNNGTELPGYDHVQVAFAEGGGQCLHYGSDEGRGNFPSGGRTVASVTWRGEC